MGDVEVNVKPRLANINAAPTRFSVGIQWPGSSRKRGMRGITSCGWLVTRPLEHDQPFRNGMGTPWRLSYHTCNFGSFAITSSFRREGIRRGSSVHPDRNSACRQESKCVGDSGLADGEDRNRKAI